MYAKRENGKIMYLLCLSIIRKRKATICRLDSSTQDYAAYVYKMGRPGKLTCVIRYVDLWLRH
jgi:hypothetical protein